MTHGGAPGEDTAGNAAAERDAAASGAAEPDPAPLDVAEPDAADDATAELAAELQRVLLVSSRVLRARSASELVSVPQFSVLAYLQRTGPSTPGALADFEHVSPPVMTRTLGRLEQAGLVTRSAHPGDGRQVQVTLTEAGEQVVIAGRERRNAWLRDRLEERSEADRDALAEASRILREILSTARD